VSHQEFDRIVDRFTGCVLAVFAAYMGTHLVLAYLAGNFS
jgi:hypothetical protein